MNEIKNPYYMQQTPSEDGSDLISRAEALNALDRLCEELEEEVQDAKENPQNYTDKFVEQTEEQVVGIAHAYHEVYDIPSAETTGALDDAIAKYVADGYMLPPSADAVRYETTATINEPISIQSNYVYVVRCKDCIHWQRTNIETIDGEPTYDCPFCGEWADANGFCSFGERREE